MSATVENFISCEVIQAALEDVWKKDMASALNTPPVETNFTNFLLSDANRASVVQEYVAPSTGDSPTQRQLRVIYERRGDDSDVSTTVTPTCSATNGIAQKSKIYTIDTTQGVKDSFKVTPEHLYLVCQGSEELFARQISKSIDKCRRKMEKILIQKSTALVGAFRSGETNVSGNVKTVQTKFSDGHLDWNLIQEVRRASLAMGYGSLPIAIGFGELDNYMSAVDSGCCGLNGLDIGQYAGKAGLPYIPAIGITDATYGYGDANHFITTALGALQILRFNANIGTEGIFTIDLPNMKKTVLFDPASGLGFDFNWNWAPCGDITVEIGLAFDLIGLPNDLYETTDALSGVTGVNEYVITNP